MWGDIWEVKVEIPTIIDDYNNIMNGVDVADQLIAYYRTKFCCRRTWMPIMFHSLDILRVNSYLFWLANEKAHNPDWKLRKGSHDKHEQFIVGCVKSLMNRAKNIRCGINENRTVRSARKKRRSPEQSGNRGKKLRTRCRFSPKNPEKALNPKRLHTNAQHDFCTRRNAKDRRTCSWCAYTKACNMRDGEERGRS